MKRALCGFLLVSVSAGFAQQQSPSNPPLHSTPPTFPQGQSPRQGMPPDTEATPPQEMSSSQLQQQIQDKLSSEPMLENEDVKASVDENTVTLAGTVDSERQHQLAVGIAQSYAGDRKIVDKIQVKEQT